MDEKLAALPLPRCMLRLCYHSLHSSYGLHSVLSLLPSLFAVASEALHLRYSALPDVVYSAVDFLHESTVLEVGAHQM